MARLTDVLKDLFGLDISEGALINILGAAREAFAAQTSLIRERLLSGTALASDETGLLSMAPRFSSKVAPQNSPVWRVGDQP